MIDENQAYLTAPDGTRYQMLDEDGNYDDAATAAAYAKGEE